MSIPGIFQKNAHPPVSTSPAPTIPSQPIFGSNPSSSSGGTCTGSSCYTNAYCVNDKSVACDAAGNSACDACDLYRSITSCKANPGTPYCQTHLFGTYFYTNPHDTNGLPQWLIEPSVALRGVEDIAMGGAAVTTTNPLWGRAQADAVSGARNVTIPPGNTTLIMNSAHYR